MLAHSPASARPDLSDLEQRLQQEVVLPRESSVSLQSYDDTKQLQRIHDLHGHQVEVISSGQLIAWLISVARRSDASILQDLKAWIYE